MSTDHIPFKSRQERHVNTPRIRKPVLKFQASAIAPRAAGMRPSPNTAPTALVAPVNVLRSVKPVILEMAASATGKKPVETVA